jgi:hypothetical protein
MQNFPVAVSPELKRPSFGLRRQMRNIAVKNSKRRPTLRGYAVYGKLNTTASFAQPISGYAIN